MARYRIFGSSEVLEEAARGAGIRPFWTVVEPGHGLLEGLDVTIEDCSGHVTAGTADPGEPGPSRAGGDCSFRWVEAAIEAAKRGPGDPGRVDAIVTAPVSKTSWNLAGHAQFPGHTELLGARFGAKKFGMLFVGPSLRVMLATIHEPLAAVRDLLTVERVFESIELAERACRALGVAHPKIAVCGLNPHAGEGGLLGTDEARVITPAIDRAKEAGIDARGPFAADTVFGAACAPPRGEGRYDCVVAMYHDQGLIPMKLVDGRLAVNVTVGLPTVRTSPAHGTAFDIAGQSRADERSMRAAIEQAALMVGVRVAGKQP